MDLLRGAFIVTARHQIASADRSFKTDRNDRERRTRSPWPDSPNALDRPRPARCAYVPRVQLTRSHRIKLAILALLLAIAVGRETEWAQRTFGLDGYWETEAARREVELWEAEALTAELEHEMAGATDPSAAASLLEEVRAARGEADQLRQNLEEARARR
ncbi:MAG: hypothetical protein ACK4QW_09350 [Alphaproteobacteria bacterium]